MQGEEAKGSPPQAQSIGQQRNQQAQPQPAAVQQPAPAPQQEVRIMMQQIPQAMGQVANQGIDWESLSLSNTDTEIGNIMQNCPIQTGPEELHLTVRMGFKVCLTGALAACAAECAGRQQWHSVALLATALATRRRQPAVIAGPRYLFHLTAFPFTTCASRLFLYMHAPGLLSL